MLVPNKPVVDIVNKQHQLAQNSERTFADLIVDYLENLGVEFVFGVPGGAIEPLYNALARRARQQNVSLWNSQPAYHRLGRRRHRDKSSIKAIVARHETGAAFMADGYARETGKLGVCCATTGPGATNLITGVASAYCDRIPMLVITPQTALPSFGKRALQESTSEAVDIVGMFEHCTNYNTLVSHPEQLEQKLVTAIIKAYQRPQGPSHLSIPMDVLSLDVGYRPPAYELGPLLRQPDVVDSQNLESFWDALNTAQNVVLVLGGECGDAADILTEFAEISGALIITTPTGKAWVNPYHPQYRGVFGFAGHDSARELLLSSHVDLVILVGCSLSELETSGWDSDALMNHRLIHVDSTLENFTRSAMAQLHVFGRLNSIFEHLIRRLNNRIAENNSSLFGRNRSRHKGRSCYAHTSGDIPRQIKITDVDKLYSTHTPIKPQALMHAMATKLPNQTRFVCDAGNSWAWAIHYLHTNGMGNFRIAMGFGAMTWAIGAAIGTAIACKDAPVVCITGDGSYLMSGQELTVAVQLKISVIFIILNDQALGMVKHGQRLGGGEAIGYELPPVDFAGVANAMGVQAYTVKSIEEFYALDFDALHRACCPILLDIHIDPEEVPPIGSRMKVLTAGRESRKTAD